MKTSFLSTFFVLATLVIANESLEKLDQASMGLSIISFALSPLPVIGQALMLIDGLVALASILARLFSAATKPSNCNCECDHGNFNSRGFSMKPACMFRVVDKSVKSFTSSKDQISGINTQIQQLSSNAANDFKTKIGKIKATISRQQLNQGHSTMNLNLPGAYKQMFADIADSENMVKEYLGLSKAVGVMVDNADKIIELAKKVGKDALSDYNNGAPVDSVLTHRTKDMETLVQSAQKALAYSNKYNALVNQRISAITASLANIDGAIKDAKQLSGINKETNQMDKASKILGLKRKRSLVARGGSVSYRTLAKQITLVENVQKRTRSSFNAAQAEVYGADNVLFVEDKITSMQTANAQRALGALKSTKKLDPVSVDQLKNCMWGLEEAVGTAPTAQMKSKAFIIVFGSKVGAQIQKTSNYNINVI